jgi:hypothetical protein
LFSAEACQQACVAKAGCKGVVFDNTVDKLCHLKQFDPCDESTHVPVGKNYILGYPC